MGKQIFVENNKELRTIVENIVTKEYGIPKDQINEQWLKDLIKRIGSVFSGEKAVVKQTPRYAKQVKNFQKYINPELSSLKLPSSTKVGVGFNRFAANYTDDLLNVFNSAKEASSTAPVWLKRRLEILAGETKDLISYMNQSRSGTVNLDSVVFKTTSVREQLAFVREEIGENLKNINKKDLQSFFNMFTNEERVMRNFQSELETLILKAKKPKPVR